MSGEYYESVSLTRNTQAKAEDINTRTESIQAGFDKLPNPHASAPTTKGFSEVFIVEPATLNTHPPTVKQVQEQDAIYGADTGIANTYAVAMDPAVTAYTEGLSIKVKIANPNDGASTIDVNLLGAKTIAKFGADNLVGGELVAGTIAGLTYDGTKFQLDSWTTVSAPLLDEDDMASNSAISASSQQAIVTYDAAQIAIHAAVAEVHGATGAVVGTTNPQTLTNKTLTAPAVNSPTGIVKGDVGLGNVDNTSDATKNAASVTLTNKSIDSDNNTISNIANADIKAGAAIDAAKIADGSVSSTEFQRLDGVTADIQGQIDGIIPVGTSMVFNQASVVGWTKKSDWGANASMIVGNTYSAGGGSDSPTSWETDISVDAHDTHNHQWYNFASGAGDQSYNSGGSGLTILSTALSTYGMHTGAASAEKITADYWTNLGGPTTHVANQDTYTPVYVTMIAATRD